MTFEEIQSLPVDSSDTVEWIEEARGIKISVEVMLLKRNPEYFFVGVCADTIPPFSMCCPIKGRLVTVFKDQSLKPVNYCPE